MDSTRLTNVLWNKFVEHGDYEVLDQDIAVCSACGKKHIECQILKSPTNPEPLNLCISCLGGSC
jgi:hypothetical protein